MNACTYLPKPGHESGTPVSEHNSLPAELTDTTGVSPRTAFFKMWCVCVSVLRAGLIWSEMPRPIFFSPQSVPGHKEYILKPELRGPDFGHVWYNWSNCIFMTFSCSIVIFAVIIAKDLPFSSDVCVISSCTLASWQIDKMTTAKFVWNTRTPCRWRMDHYKAAKQRQTHKNQSGDLNQAEESALIPLLKWREGNGSKRPSV